MSNDFSLEQLNEMLPGDRLFDNTNANGDICQIKRVEKEPVFKCMTVVPFTATTFAGNLERIDGIFYWGPWGIISKREADCNIEYLDQLIYPFK